MNGMEIENEVLDFLYFSNKDFLNENVPPDDLIEYLSQYETRILFSLLRRGYDMITKPRYMCIDHREDLMIHHSAKISLLALTIYTRLFDKGEEPRLSTFLAANRGRSAHCGPNTILFWADIEAIKGLYETLVKDGYYASTEGA